MGIDYPSPAFHFQVQIGLSSYSFKEVDGISVEVDKEEIVAGGVNSYKYKALTRPKYSDLELKKGLVPKDSLLGDLLSTAMYIPGGIPLISGFAAVPIIVHLLDETGTPSVSWAFFNPKPIGWSIGKLDATENSYVMESIKFAYDYFISM